MHSKIMPVLFFVLLIIFGCAQDKNLFEQAEKAVNNGKFNLADSLYSTLIAQYPNSSFKSQAESRLNLTVEGDVFVRTGSGEIKPQGGIEVRLLSKSIKSIIDSIQIVYKDSLELLQGRVLLPRDSISEQIQKEFKGKYKPLLRKIVNNRYQVPLENGELVTITIFDVHRNLIPTKSIYEPVMNSEIESYDFLKDKFYEISIIDMAMRYRESMDEIWEASSPYYRLRRFYFRGKSYQYMRDWMYMVRFPATDPERKLRVAIEGIIDSIAAVHIDLQLKYLDYDFYNNDWETGQVVLLKFFNDEILNVIDSLTFRNVRTDIKGHYQFTKAPKGDHILFANYKTVLEEGHWFEDISIGKENVKLDLSNHNIQTYPFLK